MIIFIPRSSVFALRIVERQTIPSKWPTKPSHQSSLANDRERACHASNAVDARSNAIKPDLVTSVSKVDGQGAIMIPAAMVQW